MGFLQRLLAFDRICIQCHNNPDADSIASAYGVYRYLESRGKTAEIVYGGQSEISKGNLLLMVRECGVPVRHTHAVSGFDLLVCVDCQYGGGNVESFDARSTAVIDHHIPTVPKSADYYIDETCQSCSTIVYEMLKEEDFPIDTKLGTILLYGIYTDTSFFTDLLGKRDISARFALPEDRDLFERLTKSNLSVAELLIANDAMYHHYMDFKRHFALVEALKCDQTILGLIGDFMIQVDSVLLTLSYTENASGYQFSMRSCSRSLPANRIAAFICSGIGSGGGHEKKAGGNIVLSKMREKYGSKSIFDVINDRICEYIDHAA